MSNKEKILALVSEEETKTVERAKARLKKEKEITNPFLLTCDCNSTEHQIVVYPDVEDRMLYLHIHLTSYGFWRRLKAGLKYIFGYKCKFGHWEEFILSEKHSEDISNILKIISNRD